MILVYQAYGHKNILEQTLFSIISLLNRLGADSPLKIVIYTDQPGYFDQHIKGSHEAVKRIEKVVVTPEQIQKWRGDINFVHRVKVEVLIDAARRFDGSLFYCDGDTFFNSDPTDKFKLVSDQTSLMHIPENQLDLGRDPLTRKICKFVRKHQFKLGDSTLTISPQSVMWNAGVIGISHKHKSLLPSVLSLTDQMHSLYPKHVMEQLAFSIILQNQTRIERCDDVIGHYWNQKDDYQKSIQEFLNSNSSIGDAVKNYNKFMHPPLAPQKPKSKSRLFGWLLKWGRSELRP